MESNQNIADWRNEISEPADTLKIADKEVVILTFKDNGQINVHPDFGKAVAFKVQKEGENQEKIWFVNSKNFDLLGQIKKLGNIQNIKVKVTRFGSTKSNTRYILEKV